MPRDKILDLPIDAIYQFSREYCTRHCLGTTPVYDDVGDEESRWIYRRENDIETRVRVIHSGSDKIGLLKILIPGRYT